ncbi:hypothetical protein LSAT2_026107 [Lamellibrachia satsuma]|nr:hypothetical protein LSAT2_026107 [Lamellibrachia satsuma]
MPRGTLPRGSLARGVSWARGGGTDSGISLAMGALTRGSLTREPPTRVTGTDNRFSSRTKYTNMITKLLLLVLLCAYCEAWFLKVMTCGGKEYYPIRSKCCNGTIQPNLPTAFCCGKEVYYKKLYEKCVDGEVVKPNFIKES